MEILHTNDNRTFFDMTFLQYIEERDKFKQAISLIQDVNNPCNLRDSDGMTMLHFAAKFGNACFAKHLISLGADVDAKNHLGQSPLLLAILSNQQSTILLLLRENADFLLTDSSGQCVLGIALKERRYIVEAVLRKVTVKSLQLHSSYVASDLFHQQCPLYDFIERSVVDKIEQVVRFLLESGSPVNAKNPSTAITALHRAVGQDQPAVVKLLMEFGADINAEDIDGRTPITFLGDCRNGIKISTSIIMNSLIEAGATFCDVPVELLLKIGNRETVRKVLQTGIDLTLRDRQGMTRWHYLAQNFHSDIFEEVRGLNFNFNDSCRIKRTMLHYAAEAGNESSIRFFLDHGAYVDAQDFLYTTPLGEVLTTRGLRDDDYDDKLRRRNCIMLLLERGADCQMITERNVDWLFNRYNEPPAKVIEPVLAHLAIIDASGQVIKPIIQNRIESIPRFKKQFELHKQQLEELKLINFDHSTTLYDFLMASDKDISLYARKRSFLPDPAKLKKARGASDYFKRRLDKRARKVTKLMKSRKKVIATLDNIFKRYWKISVVNVTEKIVDMLQDEDLYRMS